MLEKNTLVKVRNRDNGVVGYTIPDLNNLHRNFQSGEVKEITMEELRKLSYIPGGESILRNCLVIQNEEALAELCPEVEPEYFYTEQDVKNILLSGSMDQFMDCLDFAPTGVIELIKKYAVELEISDIYKREAILNKTGFNVTKAIEINHETEEATAKEEKTRRTAPINKTSASTGRRTAAPRYNVVSKSTN